MQKSIYDFMDYKKYLNFKLNSKRGEKVRLAEFMNCQPAFITQVLSGNSHISQEHAITINEFLNHNQFEADFFIILVLQNRAGSRKLENYYSEKLQQLKKERFDFGKQINKDIELSEVNKMTFYSNWYYSALHILVSIPEFNTIEKLSEKTNLEPNAIIQALNFLQKIGLVKLENGKYQVGANRIHLDKKSPLINQHHSNWRIQAVKSFDQNKTENTHYSMVTAISREDFAKIKDQIATLLSQCEKIIKDSPEENAYVLNIDWFEL